MRREVNTRDPGDVLRYCDQACRDLTGKPDAAWMRRVFDWVQDAFAGSQPAFEALDTKYHDLEHTLQGTLCLTDLLLGWAASTESAELDDRAIRLGIVAILLHDTGYLKTRGDHVGTGAKFTPIHVQRSAEFAGQLLARQGYSDTDIAEVQSMIRCTGVNADVHSLSFHRTIDRKVGCALATADLLGQMAASDYVEKLPMLFDEFAEAAARNPDAASVQLFQSANDLIRKTPAFWTHHVRVRLDRDFDGVYRYLNSPWPDGPNPYIRRIETNLARISSSLASSQ